jgi:hypothetical protein
MTKSNDEMIDSILAIQRVILQLRTKSIQGSVDAIAKLQKDKNITKAIKKDLLQLKQELPNKFNNDVLLQKVMKELHTKSTSLLAKVYK